MDILNDILDTLDLKGALYFRTDFTPPWAVRVPAFEQAARFHLVAQGSCHVTFETGADVRLGPGDLVLIPGGRSHIIADSPGQAAAPLETLLSEVGYDGQGVLVVGDGNDYAATKLVCGHLSFRRGADHPILRALPEHLLITATDRAHEPLIDEMLRLIVRRIFAEELGSAAAITRMSEIVFIEILRTAVRSLPQFAPILRAFSDRHIGRALKLIHESPADPWTVESLASEVGMSRSRFANRFSEALGQGPMSYLSDWRLQKALVLLSDARCSVNQAALQIGYRSPAAFTRAFAGKFGKPPTEFRRSDQ